MTPQQSLPIPAQRQLVDALQRKIDRLEVRARGASEADGGELPEVVSSGWPGLDRIFSGRGFRRGTLVEWIAACPASGAETLALVAAREACGGQRVLVVLDQEGEFYPPAAARAGIDLDRLIVVRIPAAADLLWALDQTLRCPAVAATLAWVRKLDGRSFRRMQLAAEEGGGLGLLLRPAYAESEPSWAEVRLRVTPLPAPDSHTCRQLEVELLRCRGLATARKVMVEVLDAPDPLHSVGRRTASGRQRSA